jgi:RHS repeat-associated protein
MGKNSGVDDEVLSLPKGGGAVQGLGATFDTDLNTGTGSYNIPIELPAGPNGLKPQVSIRYQSAAGNGPFGVGWSLGLMSIARKIDGRIPDYSPGDDEFVLTGAEDLVQISPGQYRPVVDTMHWRILRNTPANPLGWELTDTQGTLYDLGVTAQARIEEIENGLTKTAVWLLERIQDTNGNQVRYSWRIDSQQAYLEQVEWGTYSLWFTYIDRPDKLSSGRYGFLQQTLLRCSRIELHVTTVAPTLVRSWDFEYQQSPGANLTLLSGVVMNGHAADGLILSSPKITLGYTAVERRALKRFGEAFPGASPGGFGEGRFELLDWDGDGLPDVLELRNGSARVWPNNGRCRWGIPRTLAELPAPLRFDLPGVAFADMDGNGTADLMVVNNAIQRYYPHLPEGGFGRPVEWRQAPAARIGSPDARLMDLDGDGITDLLVTGTQFFTLYFRQSGGDWAERPRAIPVEEAPPVSFRDPRVHLADMNGDGLQDLVRVSGAGVVYWPYLGNGRWSAAVEMAHPPELPRQYDPARMFVVDIDGDGCADLVYVNGDHVTCWLNQGGSRLGDPEEILYTPPASLEQIRLADMTGAGTIGVLWCSATLGSRPAGYFYLDLAGSSKPYLLTTINNGVGLETRILYRSSTEFALDAAAAGKPWKTFHPFPVHCVASTELHDQVTGQVMIARNTYRDGRYDGESRTFLGFGQVDAEQVGDDSIPALLTRNSYHIGLDPSAPERHLDPGERLRFGALRRRLLRTEVYGRDGSPQQDLPYHITTHEYGTRVEPTPGGRSVVIPFETRTLQEIWERGASPFSTREITYSEPDANGNIPSQRMRVVRARVAVPDQDITTESTFATNDESHITGLLARITQKDASGAILSVSITHYDGPPHEGLPESQVAIGNVTRVDKLAIPDELAAAVYGADQPDFASLHYHRRLGEGGWWITQNSYERRSATELRIRGPRAFESTLSYDATRQYAIGVTDALGNPFSAVPDMRVFQMAATTDPNGNTTRDLFDALGRVVAMVAPSDTDAMPSSTFTYQVTSLPPTLATALREQGGLPGSIDEIQYFNGRGQPIQHVVKGEGDPGRAFIVSSAKDYSCRGQVSSVYQPYYVDAAGYSAPDNTRARMRFRYDATGRLIEQSRLDGGLTTHVHGPGFIQSVEAAGPDDPSPRVFVQRGDGLGRVLTVERALAGRTVTATYEYDSVNRIVRSVNADGGVSRMSYDLLGRLLVDEGPDTGRSVNVVDAAGNQIARISATGGIVINTVDALDRLLTVADSAGAPPDVIYTYLSVGDPLPPDGVANRIGHLWKVTDRVGTLTTSYDARGRAVRTSRTVDALPGQQLITDITYDGLGRQTRVVLPAPAPGGDRQVVDYHYGARGLPDACPGFVTAAEYDVEGHITRLTYQNGVENLVDYDTKTGRPMRLRVNAPNSVTLRDQTFSFDSRGNLVGIAAPLPVEAGVFAYDDFDRLSSATYDSGETFDFAYSDGGNITRIGDGELTYGPGSNAVTKSPAGNYEYDEAGRLRSAPYGALTFNSFDNLVRVDLAAGGRIDYEYDFNRMRAIKRVEGGVEVISADTSIEFHKGKAVVWVSFGQRRIAALHDGSGSFLHSDWLGTPTLFTDLAGNEQRRVAFGPYGALRFDSAVGAGPPDAQRFGGHFMDSETGLIVMGCRYYDPSIGRFISPDFIAPGAFSLDGWNRYIYAHNNPLRFADPTGLLSWGDVGAIAVVTLAVAALVAASIVTFGAAPTLVAGVEVSVSGIFASTAVGVAGGAILGGIAAAKAGGDIGLGVLLGGFVGGVAGFIGGTLSALTPYTLFGSHVLATMCTGALMGAVSGAGSGFAVWYAGGKGNAHDAWRVILHGALAGALTGAVLGFVVGGINDSSTFHVGTDDKFDPVKVRALASGNIFDKLNLVDTPGSSVQDVVNTFLTGKWAAFTEFVNVGTGSQSWASILESPGTVVSIPIGWVPNVALNYGGIIGLNELSAGLDRFGAIAYDKQIIFLFNAFPLVGIALGFGIGSGGFGRNYQGNADWYDTFQRFLHNNFSLQDQ